MIKGAYFIQSILFKLGIVNGKRSLLKKTFTVLMNTQSVLLPHSPFHKGKYTVLFSIHAGLSIHARTKRFRFQHLAQGHSTCRLEEPMIKLLTFQFVIDHSNLSHSRPDILEFIHIKTNRCFKR